MITANNADCTTLNETEKMLKVPRRVSIGSILRTESQNKIANIENMKEIEESSIEIKLYKRRWLQLGLFFVYAAINSMQWIQFTIVENIITRYYGVSKLAVDWTALLYHVMYIVMVFPASYLMPHIGLRWTCLIGAIGTSIGSWIKFLSVAPDRFVSLFVGQAIVASGQVFVLTGPSWLAAKWFSHNEVATATGIGFSGVYAGISLFFVITPLIIKNHENTEDIERELSVFSMTVATICTAVTAALFFFFQEEPLLPPSMANALQKLERRVRSEGIWQKIRRILTNRTFLMLWTSYGINSGIGNVISTLLNPLFLAHFQDGEKDAGTLGFLMNFPGNFGAIVLCIILDKMKNFKAINIFIHVSSLVGEILFAVGLIMEIRWLIFVAVLMIGIFVISCGTTSFDLSAEITYPEPQELSSGVLNIAQQVYGTTLVLIVGSLLRTYGDTVAHAFLIGILLLSVILALLTKDERRRQKVTENVVVHRFT